LVPNEQSPPLPKSWPWWRWLLTSLSALALALSTYLSWHYLAGGSVVGCGGGSPCDQVLSSRWSSVAGILPVSGLAAGAYLAMLLASLFLGPSTPAPDRRLAWSAMLVLASAAAGSAAWFIIVQKWLVGAFCPYCMTTHITGLLLAALVFWQAPRQRHADPPTTPTTTTTSPPLSPARHQRLLRPLHAMGGALVGLTLAGILITCQVLFTPPPVYSAGESPERAPIIDYRHVPLVGSPDAPHIVTVLFDYKCTHCQRLHSMLDPVVRQYNGQVAFALSPAPLNMQCNQYIARDLEQFKDSCELAKVSLTVWRAKRDAFPAFDHWMFSFESGDFWRPRSLDAATAKAVELVGQAPLDTARNDPWIERYLQSSVQTYGNAGGNAVPKLVFGSRWVTPEPNDVEDLLLILQESLRLPKP
jgi:uncharacterized membrane protein